MAIRPEGVGVFAPAKINLFLHVTGKRPDGYHDLQSLVAFADAADRLAIEPAQAFSLTVDGPFAEGLTGEADNLVLRAARAAALHFAGRAAAQFRLTKNLPVASGIGGGSADAAAALRGLLTLWGEEVAATPALLSLAAEIGSDIPVCLESAAAFMEGRGERIARVPTLPTLNLVLANPGVSVPTADVFRRLKICEPQPRLAPPGAFATTGAVVRYLRSLRNDLETPACAVAPVIGAVLDALSRSGALLARMSGSGATCFGVFATASDAQDAARRIAQTEKAWWVTAAQCVAADFAQPRAQ